MNDRFYPRRFMALLVKESLQILRDPSTMLIAFVLPLLLLFLFGYGVSLDTARTRIGLAVQDSSEAAASLAGAVHGPGRAGSARRRGRPPGGRCRARGRRGRRGRSRSSRRAC